MIGVTFEVTEGHFLIAEYEQNISLRDLQAPLCALFKKRFPKMMAVVTVEGVVYDDFDESPFARSTGDAVMAAVQFEVNTTDPYFYDWIARRLPKVTLAEEAQWEQQTADGVTDMPLAKWLRETRALTLPAVPEFPH